jgi:hypothetical protein
MRRFVRTATIAAVLSVGFLGSEARAASITLGAGTTTTIAVDWTQVEALGTLAAFGLFQVSVDASGDWATFLITLTNNTATSLNEKVHSIGFDVDPNATALTNPVQGTIFRNFSLYPLIQTVEVCAYTTISCAANLGLVNLSGGGASDTFGFTLQGNFDAGLTLSNFMVSFQNGTSVDRYAGTARTVPEYQSSASFLLVGLGFVVAIGGWRRVTERPIAG